MFTGWDEHRLVEEELSRIKGQLPESVLGDVIAYILSAPGKRVRPLLLLLSCQAFGGSAGQALRAALAVELAHAASLVHDDLLDCGTRRRGSPTVLERFGPEAALLAGDYLISRSLDLISCYSQPIIRSFAGACMSMADGEMRDLSTASTPEEYFKCISRKTGSLFAASARIGVLIAGAPEEDAARLELYGVHLGLGYQVLDDLEEYLGIDQGKSSQKVSVTLPRIYSQIFPGQAREMCIRFIEDQVGMARRALRDASGREDVKLRLEGILDEMIQRGLQRCRLQESLC